MNILCLCNEYTAIRIIENISFNKYFVISPEKIKDSIIPKGHKLNEDVFAYPHRLFRKGKVFKGFNWNKIMPLSKNLLEDMTGCEAETLKMYERVNKIKPNLYENRKTHYLNHLRYWEHFLEKNQISAFYRSAPPHEGYDNVVYHLCKLKGIPTYMFYYGFSPKMAYLAEDVKNPLPELNGVYESLKQEYAGGKEIKLSPILQKVADDHWYNKELSYPPVIVPEKKKKTQASLLKKHKPLLSYYESKCKKTDFDKKYIYFPLQYQYEATTCPMAGVFVDQTLTAEILSRTGISIYIKEHPRMSKNRSMGYYKKLLSLPNVKFVSIKEDNYKLVNNAFAVATATGTAGWEAVLRGKPVLIFGYNFYQYFDNVFRVNNVQDALSAVKEASKTERREVLIFLKALEQFLFEHTIENVINALKAKFE